MLGFQFDVHGTKAQAERVLNRKIIESTRNGREAATKQFAPQHGANRAAVDGRIRGLVAVTVFLIICFGWPLYDLARYSLQSELYSYIPLIPFISLYLIWLKRRNLALESAPAQRFALLPLLGGLTILAGYGWAVHAGWKSSTDDYLALMTLSFLSFLLSGCFVFLGRETLRTIAFPMGFLILIAPFPVFLESWIERALQHGAADAAAVLFRLSGTPIFRQGLVFDLPGFRLHVAPECSGIHSTLVLFITGLIAGHLFLRAPWKRALLTLCVIFVAILRNGLRIFTIGQLCVYVSPNMIDSYIHRHGGPIFFVLSLIPFFLLLFVLRKSESKSRQAVGVKH
jgi:exosortase C (VPDSG-CTERM-specific)